MMLSTRGTVSDWPLLYEILFLSLNYYHRSESSENKINTLNSNNKLAAELKSTYNSILDLSHFII